MILTAPKGLTVEDWTDQIVLEMGGNYSRMLDGDWQGWAEQFFLDTNLGKYNLPNPYYFVDWMEWADRFYGELT